MEKRNTPRQENSAATIPLFVHEIAMQGYKRCIKRLVWGLCAALAATGLLTIALLR